MTSHLSLMKKLKDIERESGVKASVNDNAHAVGDSFLRLKHMLAEGIHQTLAAIRERNSYYQKYGGCKESIEKSSHIREQIRSLDAQFAELKRTQIDQARKPKKYGGEEEIARRAKQVVLFARHLSDLKDAERTGTSLKMELPSLIEGRRLLLQGAAGELRVDATTSQTQGQRPERQLNQEEITAMQRWKEKDAEMDSVLDDIDNGVSALREIAGQVHHTVQVQNAMIDEVNQQADTTTEHMNNVNIKMKKLIRSVRSPDRFCVDIICLVILLGLAGLIYNQVQG
eukprot:GILJ01011038.1.p1 GENE.GILJ01011038.1~~GILJ01011038.1.p1  ORF type:complete len:285 (-),score=50.98 GILJ01011038.1:141-995(-)